MREPVTTISETPVPSPLFDDAVWARARSAPVRPADTAVAKRIVLSVGVIAQPG
jgi:hypothetical protein